MALFERLRNSAPAEAGAPVPEVCRKYAISEQTVYG